MLNLINNIKQSGMIKQYKFEVIGYLPTTLRLIGSTVDICGNITKRQEHTTGQSDINM